MIAHSAYIIYAVTVAVVVTLIVLRRANRHRLPVPIIIVGEPSPAQMPLATLTSLISEMVYYAYGYRPSDELVKDFAAKLMTESALVHGPVNDPVSE